MHENTQRPAKQLLLLLCRCISPRSTNNFVVLFFLVCASSCFVLCEREIFSFCFCFSSLCRFCGNCVSCFIYFFALSRLYWIEEISWSLFPIPNGVLSTKYSSSIRIEWSEWNFLMMLKFRWSETSEMLDRWFKRKLCEKCWENEIFQYFCWLLSQI